MADVLTQLMEISSLVVQQGGPERGGDYDNSVIQYKSTVSKQLKTHLKNRKMTDFKQVNIP